jgi:zinc transport system ATP-binding protein
MGTVRLPDQFNFTHLRVTNVSFGYGSHRLLAEVDLEIQNGHVIAILGHNGSGKTTLLKLLLGLLKPKQGSIAFYHGNHVIPPPIMGYINQGVLYTRLPITVREVLNLSITSNQPFITKADPLLERLRISSLYDCLYNELSGGQKQKVNLARCLFQQPEMILLDEPDAFLDIESQHELTKLLSALNRETGTAMIVVTHQRSIIEGLAHREYALEHGRLSLLSKELHHG